MRILPSEMDYKQNQRWRRRHSYKNIHFLIKPLTARVIWWRVIIIYQSKNFKL